MIKRIYITVSIILGFVLVFLVSSRIVISRFAESSDKLLTEYHELYAMQGFKNSLTEFKSLVIENEFRYNEVIDSAASQCIYVYNELENFVTERHLKSFQNKTQLRFQEIITPEAIKLENADYIKTEIQYILNASDKVISETGTEIFEEKRRNFIIKKHGSATLLVAGVIFVIIISIVSFSLARDISRPIRKFLITIKELKLANSNARVDVRSEDEFGELAKAFNDMLDRLNETSVSLEYVKTIIDNIFGALFVTDSEGRIQSYNKVAYEMLGYDIQDIKNKPIDIFFSKEATTETAVKKEINPGLRNTVSKICGRAELHTAGGSSVPVNTNCTEFQNNESRGLIVVAHDMTENIEYEKQLEEAGRRNKIAVNEAQEAERAAIASDIHDGLGQKLSAVSFSIQNIGEKCSQPEKIQYLQNLVDEAVEESRMISHSLMPRTLNDFGLITALENLIENTRKSSKINIEFTYYDFNDRINPKIEKTLYRICQEAINNILKHADAKNGVFQLFRNQNLITLMIEDDGKGFNTKKTDLKSSGGIGLFSIRERVKLFRGSFIINSAPKQGTELIVEIPLNVEL